MSSNNEKHLDIDPCEMDEEQNAAVKIAEMEAKYEKAMVDMQAKLDQMALEKTTAVAVASKAISDLTKVQAEAGASAVTPASGKKIIYTDTMHKTTHAKVVALTGPALLELKKLENNYEAIWWCVKHAEALIKGDRSDGFDKYCTWAKEVKREALKEYISPAAGASETPFTP
jgi:hypothetical protein